MENTRNKLGDINVSSFVIGFILGVFTSLILLLTMSCSKDSLKNNYTLKYSNFVKINSTFDLCVDLSEDNKTFYEICYPNSSFSSYEYVWPTNTEKYTINTDCLGCDFTVSLYHNNNLIETKTGHNIHFTNF